MLPFVNTDPYAGPGRVYGRQAVPPPQAPADRPVRWRVAVSIGVVAAVLLGAVTAWATMMLPDDPSSPTAQPPAASSPAAANEPGGAAAGASTASGQVTLSATGDIVLGNAPSGLPPNEGRDVFAGVKDVLGSGLQMGNLEQTLTDDTGTTKCPAGNAGGSCYAFRTPPGYAKVLAAAGFKVVTMANNHAFDYGQRGYDNTKKALDAVGLKYTGAPGMITVVEEAGIRIAVVGFAPYAWANDPNTIEAAKILIQEATRKADLVVVQVHMGAEGAEKTHVKPGSEIFLGENRGDPIKFSHAVIDAGADVVIGHGPHVMRGMEFYKGRLIAYSLGNFTGVNAFQISGATAVGGVLKVTLRGDGSFVEGSLASTIMVKPGVAKVDTARQAAKMVGSLSSADFGATAARVDANGVITAP